jgi:hypothetical protein
MMKKKTKKITSRLTAVEEREELVVSKGPLYLSHIRYRRPQRAAALLRYRFFLALYSYKCPQM